MDPVKCLQAAYESVIEATKNRGDEEGEGHSWLGTTTAVCGVLKGDELVIVNLGDSVGMVFRPGVSDAGAWILRTEEQSHWFDCPRQLGTNSPDTPEKDAVVSRIKVEDGDIVVLASDGLVDNIWDQEIVEVINRTLGESEEEIVGIVGEGGDRGRMSVLADRLVEAARVVATDPFAESPYMERNVDMGYNIQGGKFDDISVVAAVVRMRGRRGGERRVEFGPNRKMVTEVGEVKEVKAVVEGKGEEDTAVMKPPIETPPTPPPTPDKKSKRQEFVDLMREQGEGAGRVLDSIMHMGRGGGEKK